MGLIQLAIPFFFLLIGIELLAALLVRRRVYRLNDSLGDLGCGLLQQFAGLALGITLVIAFAAVSTHASVPAITGFNPWPSGEPDALSPIAGVSTTAFALGLLLAVTVLVFTAVLTRDLFVPLIATTLAVVGMLHAVGQPAPYVMWDVAAAWLAAWLLYDLAYYWAHRKMHEMGIGWATHAPHHSSEEYNLTVALRQGAFQRLFSIPFYLPLALLGMPWPIFLSVAAITTLYQFWIHTRLVDRIGPLEWVMNTPSHHRVHHGRDPKYIDKNHAGTFIVWDRLFGTFQPEEEEPTYGLVKPLNSFNPVWAQLHVFRDLVRESRKCRRLGDVLRVWLGPPGWRPDYAGGPLKPTDVDRDTYRAYDVRVPALIGAYALIHFVVVMGAMLATMANAGLLLTWELVALAVIYLLALSNIGELLSRRRWAYHAELLRLGVLAAVAGAALTGLVEPRLEVPAGLAWGVLAASLASVGWLLALRHNFDRRVFDAEPEHDVQAPDAGPSTHRARAAAPAASPSR